MRFGYYNQKNRVLFGCFVGGLFFLSHDKVIPRKGFLKGRIIMKTAVIAIGGNAIIMEGQKGTIEEQFDNVSKSCDHIIDLLEEGYNVVLTHGNGPHVGNSLIKGEAGKDLVPAYPMDACGAETQGLLGYVIKQSLMNRMKERGLTKKDCFPGDPGGSIRNRPCISESYKTSGTILHQGRSRCSHGRKRICDEGRQRPWIQKSGGFSKTSGDHRKGSC